MEIFSIEISDGLLNQWRHGVDTMESMETRNAQVLAAKTHDQRALLDRLQDMPSCSSGCCRTATCTGAGCDAAHATLPIPSSTDDPANVELRIPLRNR